MIKNYPFIINKQGKEPEGEFAHSKRIASKDGLEIYIGDPQELYEKGIDESFTYNMTLSKQQKRI